MANTRCNYCGQVVQFIDIRGNSTCPVCRQSSTSCCEGGSCNVINIATSTPEQTNADFKIEVNALHKIEPVN